MSVLLRLLLAAAAVCLQALAASAEFKLRYRGTSGHLIIFVHGLWGDPLESFTAKGKKSWLEVMHEDETPLGSEPALSTYSTATLGYPAGTSDRYSPADITAKLMHELSVQPELEKHEAIYFVAHSFGGLVVEQLLVNAHLSPGSRLAERTRAVFLAATPSRGAPLAEVASLLPAWARGQLVVNLKQTGESGFLDGLQAQWRLVRKAREKAGKPIAFECAYEREPTGPPGFRKMVVPSASIDSDCSAFPIPADHIEIVKPTGRDADIYKWLLRNLANLNQPPSPAADKVAPKFAKPAPPPEPNPQAKDARARPSSGPPGLLPKQQPEGGDTAAQVAPPDGAAPPKMPDRAGGKKDTAELAGPVTPTLTPAPAGTPVVRLVGLEPRLDALVRLNWRLKGGAKLLPKDGDEVAATHELHVGVEKGELRDAVHCGLVWKRTWTLEFELAPLARKAPAHSGKVAGGACHGSEDSLALDKRALEAAVRAMVRELDTWSMQ